MKRPNIVLFITDSQGWNLLGKAGTGQVKTPNIDRLAEEGIQFNRAYNTCPLCTPARAGLFTGQFPHNTGAWTNDLPLGNTVRTMGEYFAREGYNTAFIGKWHLDGTDYFGTGIPAEGYDPDYWYDGRNYLEELTRAERLLWRNGLKDPGKIRENNITREFTWGGRITDKAIEFLDEQDPEKPYLLVVSYDEPHDPSLCPPPYCDMYQNQLYPLPDNFKDDLQDKPVHHQEWAKHFNMDVEQGAIKPSLYMGAATFIDDEIGRVLQKIDDLNRDNTATIFTSDHGHYMGAHRLRGKGPALYEEVIRVPLIIRYPEIIRANQVSDSLISQIDILPTLLDLAQIEILPILEGKSCRNLLEEPDSEFRKQVFTEFNRYSITHDSWFGYIPIRSIVTDTYKLVINLHQTDELYYLKDDPGELDNLIEYPDYQDIRNKLHHQLITWMNKSRDPFRGPVWQRRHWQQEKHSFWIGGERRPRSEDGFLPISFNYNTGLPVEN